MQISTIHKAGRRLELAYRQLELAAQSSSFEEFESHWYVFLVAANNAFTILLKGANKSPRTRQWFGECRKSRDADPLTSYFYRARGDDEHGISSVTSQTITQIGHPTGKLSNKRGYLTEEFAISQDDGWSFFAELEPVKDQNGNVYLPPAASDTVDREVAAIDAAQLYLEWLQKVFERCAELA